ncbi:hypothetical protein DASC09_031170 [Saccharomycopsis crataegensis]|uniref:Nuclear movement protein nudC n=1 Tax=Saccharomycopsis crataegensis TaxID=43959 RepID=A0AAV5QMF1_9ASCO|nr:hypothetical protein DASC09_031170 [Saccharomycopsis crataegensis]
MDPSKPAEHSLQAIAKERSEQKTLPYTWKQTLEDISVTIAFANFTKPKELSIKITNSRLCVENLTTKTLIVDDDLFTKIDEFESTWSVVDQRELEITLVKIKEEWWPHVVKSAPKIDVRRIGPQNSSLNDLDGETRAMVEKMMMEQREQKIADATGNR